MVIPDLAYQVIIWLEQIILTILKGGFVCVYLKESLAVRLVACPYLKEYLLLEVFNQNRKDYVVLLYKSPSQTHDQFNDFLLNFEQLLSDSTSCNPSFLLMAGDFNARTSSWFSKDSATLEGTEVEVLTCSYELNQHISNPTHILQN